MADQELEKINTLDEKIAVELGSIQNRVESMQKGGWVGAETQGSDISLLGSRREPTCAVPCLFGAGCCLPAEMMDFEDIEGLRGRAGGFGIITTKYTTTARTTTSAHGSSTPLVIPGPHMMPASWWWRNLGQQRRRRPT